MAKTAKINIGDRVRIKNRKDWPSPPGYKLANSEGQVVEVEDWAEEDVEGFIKVQLQKTKSDFEIGTQLTLRSEAVEKI